MTTFWYKDVIDSNIQKADPSPPNVNKRHERHMVTFT